MKNTNIIAAGNKTVCRLQCHYTAEQKQTGCGQSHMTRSHDLNDQSYLHGCHLYHHYRGLDKGKTQYYHAMTFQCVLIIQHDCKPSGLLLCKFSFQQCPCYKAVLKLGTKLPLWAIKNTSTTEKLVQEHKALQNVDWAKT